MGTRHTSCRATVRMLEEEIAVLRRRLQDAPRRVRVLEERLLETKNRLDQAATQNQKLAAALEETRQQLAMLRAGGREADRTAQPVRHRAQGQRGRDADVHTAGRKLRVNVEPTIEVKALEVGQEVLLNEASNIVDVRYFEIQGEVVDGQGGPRRHQAAGDRPRRRGAGDRDRIADARGVPPPRRPRQAGRPAPAWCSRSWSGPRSRSWCSRRCPTSPTRTSAGSASRSRTSRTPSSCRTSTRSGSTSTTCRRRRACSCTGHRDAARPSSPRRWPTAWPRRWQPRRATRTPGPTSSTSRAPSCSTSTWARPSARSG